jgi:hypothetical protein
MASYFDLRKRLAELPADLDVASLYRSAAPAWLLTAVRPEGPTVVNVKGLKQDDVLVVMRLADFEALVRSR